jgi:general secretion pathway protein D
VKWLNASLAALLFVAACPSLAKAGEPRAAPVVDFGLGRDGRYRSPLVGEGVAKLQAGDYRAAQEAFSRALRDDPQNAYLHFLNGMAYHLLARQGQEAQGDLAELGYRQALQFDPNAWWAAYGLGMLHVERKAYAQAQDDFARVLLVDRDNAGALHGLAVASYYLGDLGLAQDAVQRALALRPADPAVLRSAAMIAAALGRPDQARLLAQRYARAEPPAFRRAALQSRLGDWSAYHAADAAEPAPAPPPLTGAGPAPPADPGPRQVLVDVIFVGVQDQADQVQGVNLLRGLQLQYGYVNSRAQASLIAGQTPGAINVPQLPLASSIVRTITIPTVTYSLNIFNTRSVHDEVLARPTLMAQEGKPSSFFSGRELTIGLNGQFSGTLEKLEVGLSLDVLPKQVGDDRVTLQISLERTGFDDNLSGTFQQAVQTAKNRVSATVTLGYDQTLILTGLTDRERGDQSDRTPFLGEVPGLRYLFKDRQVSDNARSVLVMLTPRRPGAADPLAAAASGAGSDVEALKRRWADAGGSAPRSANLAATFRALQRNGLFRELREGDVALDEWKDRDTLARALQQDLEFLRA